MGKTIPDDDESKKLAWKKMLVDPVLAMYKTSEEVDMNVVIESILL